MEIPVHDIVNTGEETFRVGNGVTGLINLSLTRWDWRKIIPSKLFLQAIYQPALGISPSGWKRQGSPIPTVEGQNKISPCNENILVGKNNVNIIFYISLETFTGSSWQHCVPLWSQVRRLPGQDRRLRRVPVEPRGGEGAGEESGQPLGSGGREGREDRSQYEHRLPQAEGGDGGETEVLLPGGILREGFPKKSSCSFGLRGWGGPCPIFFVHFSQTLYIGSIRGWGGRGRPLPKFFGTLAFKKVVQVVQIRVGNLDKIQKNSYFFRETVP